MQQADRVSEDDLYLLHEIMIRCQHPEQIQNKDGQLPGQMSIEDYQVEEKKENEPETEEKEG